MSRIQNPGGGLQSRVLHLMVESRNEIYIFNKDFGVELTYGYLK